MASKEGTTNTTSQTFVPTDSTQGSRSTPSTTDLDPPGQVQSSDPTFLPLTSRHTSSAWNHYKRKLLDGEIKAECNYCKKNLSGGPKAGTSHLREHTKHCPKKSCTDIRQSRLFGTSTVIDKDETLSLAPYQFRQEHGRRDLAEMIILHEYPLAIAEHYGFRKYSNTLQPGFKVPCRNTVKKDCLGRYESEKGGVIALLNKIKGRVALTTDMWTSTNQRKGYMAITAHFIDNSWKLQSQILRFLFVPPPHNAEVLSKTLLDQCIYDWNLDLKLSSITLDNCTTNDAVMDILWEKLPFDSLILGGQFLKMRCCAHIVNLVVQHGLSVIGDAIERVRNSVLFWTASPARVHKFESLARKHVPSCQKKLVIDCKTRWNSTYDMLKVAIVYREVFDVLKGRESNSFKCAPTSDDWVMAEKICDKLELFNDVTHDFSSSKTPTANIYFASICTLRVTLSSWLSSSNKVIRDMTSCMLEKFNKYWVDVNGLLAVAAILDPRYKVALVRFYFKKIYQESDVEREVSKIRGVLRDLVEEYVKNEHKSSSSRMQQPSSFGDNNASTKKGKVSMDEFAQYMELEESFEEKSDLDKYLGEPNIPLTEDFDILSWWRTNGATYPTLQKIARDILCIPVSSVPSEQVFSTGGRVLSAHRSRLLPSTVEALMCAQNWVWANIRGSTELKEMEYSEILEELEEEEEAITEEIDCL